MEILDLPNELLLLIAENLLVKDLSHFLSTCRHLLSLLTPQLHELALQDVGTLTAIQWAATYGHASLVELAISKGAKVDERYPPAERDHYPNKTLLHAAAERDHSDVIRVLVKHGAQIDATVFTLHTPLHLAVKSNSLRAVRVLLELGADMTRGDLWGQYAARLATRRGLIDHVKLFVDAGLDFSDKDPRGRTILHDALWSGEDMLEYLLKNGGGEIINVQDRQGATPLHLAGCLPRKDRRDKRLVRLLLRNGADKEAKDKRGRTPNIGWIRG